jgi:hypothetical protein
MNWFCQKSIYKPCLGHYKLNSNKKIKQSKTTYSCWVKKYDYIDFQINIKIKLKDGNLEFSYKKAGDKKIMVSSEVIIFEPNFSYESIYTYHSNSKKNVSKDYIVLAKIGKDFFYVHLTEAIK